MSQLSILLDTISRVRCIECEAPLSSRLSPLCLPCQRRLPWWRVTDGCPRCGSPEWMSPRKTADRINEPFEGCPGCLAEGSGLHGCRALLRYEGSLRRWIPGFKNAGNPFGPAVAIRLAIDHFATELAHCIAKETSDRPDLIVSIPIHPRRHRWRGFNQADPIARRLATGLGVRWLPDALKRVHATREQATLIGRERRENVRRAFRATGRMGAATRIWLVDDVLTTGNTLDAAADALLDAGALEVRGLTLAATLPSGCSRQGRSPYHAALQINRSHGSK